MQFLLLISTLKYVKGLPLCALLYRPFINGNGSLSVLVHPFCSPRSMNEVNGHEQYLRLGIVHFIHRFGKLDSLILEGKHSDVKWTRMAESSMFSQSKHSGIALLCMFVAPAMRYNWCITCAKWNLDSPKPFFWASMVTYVIGLVTASFNWHRVGFSQLVLLYAYPACTLAFTFTGI